MQYAIKEFGNPKYDRFPVRSGSAKISLWQEEGRIETAKPSKKMLRAIYRKAEKWNTQQRGVVGMSALHLLYVLIEKFFRPTDGNAMRYATINGNGLKIHCPDEKIQSGSQPKIIGCLLKLSFIVTAPVFRGAICRIGLAIGASCIRGSVVGLRAVFGSMFSSI